MKQSFILFVSLWTSFLLLDRWPGTTAAEADDRLAHSDRVEVKVEGGANRVSGSMAILETDSGRWMIDCGLFYPEVGPTADQRKADANGLSARLPVGATSVDGIFLTHAHLDHIGRLPLFFRSGYRGPIYATRITTDIAKIMLVMQIRYEATRLREWVWSSNTKGRDYIKPHWHPDCKWRSKISGRNRRMLQGTILELETYVNRGRSPQERIKVSPCKVCAAPEVQEILDRVVTVELDQSREIRPGFVATAIDAGHIPGSSSWLFEVNQGDFSGRLLFSGDIGSPHSTLIEGPRTSPAADALFVETTYGCKNLETAPTEELRKFRHTVGTIIKEGGIAWIPAFALDRSQKVLHEIRLGQEEGSIPDRVPIYFPSPTGNQVSAVYEKYRLDGGFRVSWSRDASFLKPPGLIDRLDLEGTIPAPAIVITTSGMMEKAFSEGLLERLLPRSDVKVLLVGYQDPFSPGGMLREKLGQNGSGAAKKGFEWKGRTYDVEAEVLDHGGFSAHAKANDLDAWMASQKRDSTQVYLVHGKPSALRERQACLLEAGWKHVSIPEAGQRVEIRLPRRSATNSQTP